MVLTPDESEPPTPGGGLPRAANVVVGVAERGEFEREVRRGCTGRDEIDPSSPPLSKPRPFASRVELALKERPRSPSRQPPEGLNQCERKMWQRRQSQLSRGQIAPEEDLGVPRHSALES